MGLKQLLGVESRSTVMGIPVGPKRTDWSQLVSKGRLGKTAGIVAAGAASLAALSWLVSEPSTDSSADGDQGGGDAGGEDQGDSEQS